eukprot:8481644-Pyramimonas_sp.AAC.1
MQLWARRRERLDCESGRASAPERTNELRLSALTPRRANPLRMRIWALRTYLGAPRPKTAVSSTGCNSGRAGAQERDFALRVQVWARPNRRPRS